MVASIEPYETTVASIVHAHTVLKKDPEVLLSFYYDRAARINPKINALSFFDQKLISSQLARLRDQLRSGARLPLAGVPIAVKDNICTKDMPTTCASRFLKGFKPVYDATAVSRLVAAGAIIFAKANMDEFAMGSSNEHSAFGSVRNPWNQDHVPGGSSGGSAACVAADLVPAALGSDTGGSVRQPASFCGVVGFKPSYGAISRYGLIAYASSFDQIGFLTRHAKDAAILSSVLGGFDEKDATSKKGFSFDRMHPDHWSEFSFQGKRIGRISNLKQLGAMDGQVSNAEQSFMQCLSDQGARFVDVTLPLLDKSLAIYYLIATAEASSNLARFDGVRFGRRTATPTSLSELYHKSRSEGFGQEVKQRIMLGTYVLTSGYYNAYYGQALNARRCLKATLDKIFTECDMLLLPTTPTPAFAIGEKTKDPLTMYLSDVYTIFANLAGLPAVSIPSGTASNGLPIGMQLVGPYASDATLLQGAHAYEQATNWWQKHRPSL